MSLQAANDFIKKAKATTSIQAEVQEGTTESLVDIGHKHGFKFTREELKEAMSENQMKPKGDDGRWAGCWVA